MIRQSERKSKEISQLPEAALKLVVYPELGLAGLSSKVCKLI